MCGIAGAIAKNKVNLSEDVKTMTRLLRHRGPDYTGFFNSEDKGVYLGFNRLSIVDLSEHGNQPMFNEDKSIALVLNGEIYNYMELRKTLEDDGHRFSSLSDAETVVHAYEKWGGDCVTYLRGMFGFAIWDSRKNRLMLARDRIGIKPLYYMNNTSVLCFASEIKAFLGLENEIWSPKINADILDMYLSFPFIMNNENTILKDVKKLPPAHIAIFEDGRLKLIRYWKLSRQEGLKVSFDEAVEETERVIRDAIECHLIGDVPIALMLSGGLDSSVIGALALKCNKRPSVAITAGHDYPYDERAVGKKVAEFLGIKHIQLDINPSEAASRLEEIIWYFDDLSMPGFFYQFFLSWKIRELGFKAVILGQGADEIFGGYHIFKLAQRPFNLFPRLFWNFMHYRMLTNKKLDASYLKYNRLFNSLGISQEKNFYDRMTRYEIELQLPNYNCVADDKGYMSHSVEARVPYLDHRVIEYAYSLPQEFKLKGKLFTRDHKVIKYLLRSIAKKYLPSEIAGRKKQGVALSIIELIERDLAKARDHILSEDSISKQILGVKKLNSLFAAPRKNSFLLTRLYVLEIWKKQYMNKQMLVNM